MQSGSFSRRVLRAILVMNGVVTLCALPAVFMPTSTMNQFHHGMGLGELPRGPIVEYLTRSLSAFYVAFGVFTLALTRDLKRNGPLISCWGCTMLGFGAVLLWVDLAAKMPVFWTVGEFVYLMLVGSLVLALQYWENSAKAQTHPSE